MLISIEFPIADSRGFIENAGRLPTPGWPLVTPDKEFVRGHGVVRIRPKGGLVGWVGENEICEAAQSIRFCGCPTATHPDTGEKIRLRVAYRRFFFDGLGAAKIEVGLATRSRAKVVLPKRIVRELVEKSLRRKVRIRQPGGGTIDVALANAGKHLASWYSYATTKVGHSAKPEEWWVRAGQPLVFAECSVLEDEASPFFARHVALPHQYDFDLYHCLVPFTGGSVRMWLLDEYTDEFTDSDVGGSEVARRLRIYLLRLHVEHECLRLVLRNILSGNLVVRPRSTGSDELQRYFNEATRRIGILEAKSSGQFDNEICEIARESMNLINPGQLENLERVVSRFDLRGNVLRKVEQYAKQWGNVTIIENVGENYMGDVIRDIHQSIIATRGSIAEGVISLRNSGNTEVADAINELSELIANAPEHQLSPEKKQESTELLKGITQEATKPEPSKNILRSLGATLLSILTSVEPLAAAGKTALEIIKTLWT